MTNDVTRRQLGNEHLLDVGLEGLAVDRPVEQERGDDAARAQAGDEVVVFR